ncbi:MAG: hypothetical protein J6A01_00320 [Proteobacteria bacterium]|nr:hypothetical protein [Pseudomonadota bacterium]
MRNYKYIAVLAAFFAGAVSGCSDDSSKAPQPEQRPVVGQYEACGIEADCEDGLLCIDGVCTTAEDYKSKCTQDIDCGEGMHCLNNICKPLPVDKSKCTQDSECDDGKICYSGRCVSQVSAFLESCSGDLVCGDGLVCSDSRICLKEAAVGDSCDEDTICTDSQCIESICTAADEDADNDGDGISNLYDSCNTDTDGDGIFDCQDEDSDGDTIPDSVESGNQGDIHVEPVDSDYDGIYDFLDTDSDNNTILDRYEGCPDVNPDDFDPDDPVMCTSPADTDGDTTPDYADSDNDNDYAVDIYEIAGIEISGVIGKKCDDAPCEAGTADNPWDSDGDTIPDYNDTDSDGDTIPDELEGDSTDTDEDGVLDRYSLDSDGDTVPDSMEASEDGPYTFELDGVTTYCFRSLDCDYDGVADKDEILCDNGNYGLNTPDTDGDGYTDLAERTAAIYALEHNGGKLLDDTMITSVADLVCSPEYNVQKVFEFYFELPYGGPEKDDDLRFDPAISKLDVVFNMDTTQTMGGYITRLQNKVRDVIIPGIREAVDDVGFAVTKFDDFPTNRYAAWENNIQSLTAFPHECHDMPFELYSTVTTDDDTVVNAINKYSLHDGEDSPESGYEALWQIVKGDDVNEEQVSWTAGGTTPVNLVYSSGKLDHCTPPEGTWGCAGFRPNTLPLVIHFTDTLSHDNDRSYTNYSNIAYSPDFVHNPHYSQQVLAAYKDKGARIITLDRAAIRLRQLRHMSVETNAIVPSCAFRQSETEWRCGENKCCTNNKPNASTVEDWFNEDWIGYTPEIEDRPDSCELSYAINSDEQLDESLIDGIRALIAYGTYDVSTTVRGDPNETKVDTACFIKKIVATLYVAPPAEPEKSCTPVAVPTKLNGADYNNGFTNFAPGRSSVAQQGSQLHFQVIAQNDTCVEQTDTAQIFKAYIDVINPTTNLLFDTREVSIIVPAKLENIIVN